MRAFSLATHHEDVLKDLTAANTRICLSRTALSGASVATTRYLIRLLKHARERVVTAVGFLDCFFFAILRCFFEVSLL